MNITSGIIKSAQKVVIYGPEGIGKSTFASQFPDPLFIDTEGSTKKLNVRRYDKPTSWEMLMQQISYTAANKPCKTLVIDTVDWAEQLCIEAVCSRHGKKGIEDFGYGNGWVYEKEEFGRFLNSLEEVIAAGINVVLTAHAILRKFEQPDELGAYDRWELKLGKKTTNMISSLVKEWADTVLFANYKTLSVAVDKEGKKHKAQGGVRVMYTSHHPCWDAKNRDGLPEEIPMDYAQIKDVIESNTEPFSPASAASPEPVSRRTDLDKAIDTGNDSGNTKIPKNLSDLMAANNVTEAEIRHIVSSKGYFPKDMPVSDYPRDFIDGVLVGAWEQVYGAIIAAGDQPF